jgi:F-type H+-transporting ATPase subunit gamma
MATLRDIKNRITGVQNTQKITNAMKMVAAAKLRRAQENVINARPYANEISKMLSHLVTEDDKNNNPYVVSRKVENAAVVIVTADRGLCGAFNTNLIRESVRFINEELNTENITPHLFCIGKKGYDYFNKRNYTVASSRTDMVVIIYNEFKSIISQKIVISQFLPVPINNDSEKEKSSFDNYIYEPDQNYIFNFLLPKHLKAQLWRVLLESNAAELGAKMTAMDNATTNAKELIHTLRIKYNKERQAAITKEILEIVSGANALKSE